VIEAAERLARLAGTDLVIATVQVRVPALIPEAVAFQQYLTADDALASVFPEVCAAMLGSEVHWSVTGATGIPAVELAALAAEVHAAAVVVGVFLYRRSGRDWNEDLRVAQNWLENRTETAQGVLERTERASKDLLASAQEYGHKALGSVKGAMSRMELKYRNEKTHESMKGQQQNSFPE